MRVALLSDIHANLEALQATLKDILAQRVDRIVCVGDVVGYNANPAECIAALREHDPLWIAGNHDRAVTGQITTEGFSDTASRAIAWTRKRLGLDVLEFLAGLPLKASIANHLVAVHGALHPEAGCEVVRIDNDERRRLSFEALVAHPSRARICAFGHTHRVEIFELRDGLVRARTGDEVFLCDDAYYLINPGTVGEPRTGERRATYLVLDTGRRVLTVRRVEYDASVPFAKTRKAGLSPPFSFLPVPVRNSLRRGARTLGLYDLMRRMGGSRARRSPR
jgi:predicted phosphodiesterase